MTFQTIARTAASAALALSLLTAGHVCAQPEGADALSVRVDLSDLDLQKASGMNQAMARIQAAATTVCGGRPDIRRLEDVQAYGRCYRQSMTGAAEHLQSVAANGQKTGAYALAAR